MSCDVAGRSRIRYNQGIEPRQRARSGRVVQVCGFRRGGGGGGSRCSLVQPRRAPGQRARIDGIRVFRAMRTPQLRHLLESRDQSRYRGRYPSPSRSSPQRLLTSSQRFTRAQPQHGAPARAHVVNPSRCAATSGVCGVVPNADASTFMALVSVHAGCHAGGGRHRDAVVSCDHVPHVHARAKRASAVSVTLEALRISHPLALKAEDASSDAISYSHPPVLLVAICFSDSHSHAQTQASVGPSPPAPASCSLESASDVIVRL